MSADYRVKDIALAQKGREAIRRAEKEMQGLMATYDAIPRGSAVKTLQVHRLRDKARGGSTRTSAG